MCLENLPAHRQPGIGEAANLARLVRDDGGQQTVAIAEPFVEAFLGAVGRACKTSCRQGLLATGDKQFERAFQHIPLARCKLVLLLSFSQFYSPYRTVRFCHIWSLAASSILAVEQLTLNQRVPANILPYAPSAFLYRLTVWLMPCSSASAVSACPIETSASIGTCFTSAGRLATVRSCPAFTASPILCALAAVSCSFSSSACARSGLS